MGRLVGLSALFLTAGFAVAQAEPVEPYFDTSTVNLAELLPPPPAPDSRQTKAELGELLMIQVTRTPEMVARAQADAVEEVWRFADVLGPKFNPESLPKTTHLFDRLLATDDAVMEPAKAHFARPHPYTVSDLVKPVVKLSTSGSWPSSHSSLGTLMGVILSDMLPEKRATLMERAWDYGENRVIAGAHFASDVEMGRIAGTAIAAAALHQPTFVSDYAAARSELRAALGLS